MKPLFADSPAPTATAVPPGFQAVDLTPQVAQPIVPYVADNRPETRRVVATGRVITDDMIDKLGSENATAVAATTKKILENVKASDTEGMGKKLNEIVATAKKLDPNKLGKPGFFGSLLGIGGNVKERLMGEFASVETQMNRLVVELDKMAKLMDQRVKDCDTLFDENKAGFDRLGRDIETGQQMLVEIQASIDALGQPKDGFEAQQIADLQARYQRLEKRIDDFERGRTLALIAAPDIRAQQGHCRSLVSTSADLKVTTIPAYMGIFSRYIIGLEAKKGAELTTAIQNATDEAFRMQADQMRENARVIATAQQRAVVSLETLEHMKTQLLGALDDAQKIAEEGRKAREAGKPKLKELEQGLIQRFSPQNLITN